MLPLGVTNRRVAIIILIVGVLLYSHSAYLQYTVLIQVEGNKGRNNLLHSTE